MTNYEFWSLWIQFIVAIGTTGSVIVALYLASIRDKPQLKVEAGIKYFTSNQGQDECGVLVIVRNVGVTIEKVELYGYQIGIFRKYPSFGLSSSCIVKTDGSSGANVGKGIPSTLEPGSTAIFFISKENFKQQQLNFFTDALNSEKIPQSIRNISFFSKIALMTAVCWISTSRGTMATNRIDNSLRDFIIEEFHRQKNNSINSTATKCK